MSYEAKHMRPPQEGPRPASRARRPRLPKRVLVMVLGTVLVFSAAGLTLAWFSDTEAVRNVFVRGEIDPEVQEQFEGAHTVKKDVAVHNKGTMKTYLRASVSIYWMDADGKQLFEAPVEGAGNDYTIAWGKLDAGTPATPYWILGNDGFYYWSVPVEAGASTGNLINEVAQVGTPDPNKRLVVDIATQALQAEGTASTVFADSWGASGLAAGADGALSKA